jgi:hypothetical protein
MSRNATSKNPALLRCTDQGKSFTTKSRRSRITAEHDEPVFAAFYSWSSLNTLTRVSTS